MTEPGAGMTEPVPRDARGHDPDPADLVDLARVRAIGFESESLVVADGDLPDWPIVYANDAFHRLTGWSPARILGRNCRLLQGRFLADNAPQRALMREALRQERPVRVVLRNERPDGTDFWNEVKLIPLRVGDRRLTVGLQRDLTRYLEAAVRARHGTSQRLAAFDSIGDALFLLQQGHIAYANPAARRLLGGSAIEELLGQPLERFIAPRHVERARAHYARVDALTRVAPYEIDCLRLDGTPFVAELTVTQSTFGDEPAVQILMRDASERAFERGLLEHERAVLRLIAQGAPMPAVLTALCDAVERRQPGAVCSVETLDAATGTLRVVAAPSLPAAYAHGIDGQVIGPRAGSCGTAAHLDRTVIASDIATDPRWGPYRAAALALGLRACWAVPFHDTDGQVAGTFAIYHRHVRHPSARESRLLEASSQLAAIAVRQRTLNQALRSSEQQRGVIFDTVRTGLLMLDAQGTVLDANPAARAMLHGLCTALVGRDLRQLLSQAALPGDGTQDDAALDGVWHTWLEVRQDRLVGVRTPTGAPRWLRLQVSPIPDGGSRPAGQAHHVATLDDLTEIVSAKRALERTDALRNEFIAMMGHELRNPLAPIANAIEILARAGGDARVRESSLAMMRRQVGHLTRLVGDMLEVARIQQGRIHLHLERLSIGDLLHAAAEAVRPDTEARGQTLDVDLPDAPLHVHGDATRLAQVLSNLLNNAAKYTPRGGAIRLRARAPGEMIEIAVEDDGSGIAPDLLPQVFDLFTQAQRTLDRAEGGLGIGLALVRRLVRMHDGEVEARSAGVGRGATFIVRLPLAPPADSPTDAVATIPVAPAPVTGDAPRPVRPRRLLLVGPRASWTESIGALLATDGHDVALADGTAPGAPADAPAFDVVIIDVGRLDDTDVDALRAWRASAALRDAGWIAISRYGRASDRERLRALGIGHVLTQPVTYAPLAACLAALDANASPGPGAPGPG